MSAEDWRAAGKQALCNRAEVLQLKVLSPGGLLYEGRVHRVTLPGSLGLFTVLPQHAPLLASLTQGTLTIVPVTEAAAASSGAFSETFLGASSALTSDGASVGASSVLTSNGSSLGASVGVSSALTSDGASSGASSSGKRMQMRAFETDADGVLRLSVQGGFVEVCHNRILACVEQEEQHGK